MGLAVVGLLVPSQVYAAGQDRVGLSQDGSDVGVSLEMSNAVEEKITAVSVSLEIKTQGQDQIIVNFQFSPELEETEHGYVYNEETGRLDIYAASANRLFEEERLNLGRVQVLPADSTKTVLADVSYCQNSFQTANGSYGDKIPVVEGEGASVNIQVGSGRQPPPAIDEPGGDTNIGGNQGSEGTGLGGGTAGDSGEDNRSDGLYDETTQFKNNPADAQAITTEIVKSDVSGMKMVDLTVKAPVNIKTGTGTAAGQVKTRGNVFVVAPEDGPSSILVSKEENEFLTGSQKGELFDGVSGDDPVKDENVEEILLDQESGGAVDTQRNKRKKLLIAAGAVLMTALIAGGVVISFVKYKEAQPERGKRRRKKKRRKAAKGRIGKRSRTIQKQK